MRSPVLFLVFNRPDPTAQVFAAIRAAQPPRLYVAADGPRPSRADEAQRCAQVRAIATAVDWPCTVHTLFRDENLGCKRAVSGAIDWFFAAEPEGIVIEDDVLPDASFFAFCDALLERYRDDPTVSSIGGYNLLGDRHRAEPSYVFSHHVNVWGWASWRRAWAHYDVTMAGWADPAARQRLAEVLGQRRQTIRNATLIFDRMAAGEIDTWDYQWLFASLMHNMVAAVPTTSLTANIGFGVDATHTTGAMPAAMRAVRTAPMAFPLRHPDRSDVAAIDIVIERHAARVTPLFRLRTQLARLPWLRRAVRRWRGGASTG